MPIVNESDLENDAQPCTECDEFEGAIFLCGDGYLCERCFAELSGVPETFFFTDEYQDLHGDGLDRFNLKKDKVKAKLANKRSTGGEF